MLKKIVLSVCAATSLGAVSVPALAHGYVGVEVGVPGVVIGPAPVFAPPPVYAPPVGFAPPPYGVVGYRDWRYHGWDRWHAGWDHGWGHGWGYGGFNHGPDHGWGRQALHR